MLTTEEVLVVFNVVFFDRDGVGLMMKVSGTRGSIWFLISNWVVDVEDLSILRSV